MNLLSLYSLGSFIVVVLSQARFSDSSSNGVNSTRSSEVFNSSTSILHDSGLESDVDNISKEVKGTRKKKNSHHSQNPHRRKIKENKHRKNKRRRKDRKKLRNRSSFPLHSGVTMGNKTSHKTDANDKNLSRKFKRKRKLKKGLNSTKHGNENPFLTTALLRGKRLSHNPRRFRLNGRRGQGHSISRSLLGSSPDWVRNLHYHHERLASSMRKRIQNQLERTRQHWINSIDPHSVLYNSIPTFPDITDNLIPSIPSFYSSFIPSSRRKKNNYPTITNKDGKGTHFVESKPKNFVPGIWTKETTTKPSVFNNSYTINKDQKQFKVTRTLFSSTSTTTEKNIFNKFNPEEGNSVWINPEKEFSSPKPEKNNPKNFHDNKIPPLTEKPIEPPKKVPKEEKVEGKWGTKYIPYGNDITKGINSGWSGKGRGKEKDWEWVPLHKEDNDVNYNPTVIEEDEKEEGEKNEDEEKEEEEEETQIETTNNEDEVKEVKPQIDVDNCLKCPSRRRIHSPKGQYYVPLFIPTPQDACNQRGILRYHVEVGPGNSEPGTLQEEGRYFINVTILGGDKGLTPLKTCTYDYEVEISKCPPLPSVQGGSVECSAGDAWGSKCFWKCDKDRRLIGSSTTSCGGDQDAPSWQNKPPQCEEYGCLIPKGLEGMSISCSIPVPHEILGKKLERMKFYPKGTRCQVKCKPGFALKDDEPSGRNVQMSKCLANGKWFPDISNCCTREMIPPQPFIGDCDDMNVQLTGQGSIHLISPRFFTSTGKPAHVWCDLDTVQQEGRHCRTCKAHDKSLGLVSSCRQCINVSSRLGCPSIRAPKNGNLECRNTAEGDILCSIACKNGYFMPPYISANSVKCRRGMSLWDFQTYRNELLPSCVLR